MRWALLIAAIVGGVNWPALAQSNAPGARMTLVGGRGSLNDIAFFADGARLLGGGSDSMVRIWNLADGAVVKAFDIGQEVNSLAVSPNGSMFAALVRQREIYLIDIAAEKLIHRYTESEPHAMHFTPDGGGLIVAARGGQVRILDVTTKQSRSLFSAGLEAVHGMTISADGKLLAMTGTPPAAARGARSARASRRGLTLPMAPASAPGRLKVFDISAGLNRAEQLVEFPVPSAAARSPAFSPDGKLIAAVGTRAHVWAMSDGAPQWSLEGQSDQLGIAFAPNSRVAAVGASDSTIRVVLSDTAREIRSYTTGAGPVRAVRFSPDGKTLAAICGRDVALFDVSE